MLHYLCAAPHVLTEQPPDWCPPLSLWVQGTRCCPSPALPIPSDWTWKPPSGCSILPPWLLTSNCPTALCARILQAALSLSICYPLFIMHCNCLARLSLESAQDFKNNILYYSCRLGLTHRCVQVLYSSSLSSCHSLQSPSKLLSSDRPSTHLPHLLIASHHQEWEAGLNSQSVSLSCWSPGVNRSSLRSLGAGQLGKKPKEKQAELHKWFPVWCIIQILIQYILFIIQNIKLVPFFFAAKRDLDWGWVISWERTKPGTPGYLRCCSDLLLCTYIYSWRQPGLAIAICSLHGTDAELLWMVALFHSIRLLLQLCCFQLLRAVSWNPADLIHKVCFCRRPEHALLHNRITEYMSLWCSPLEHWRQRARDMPTVR